MRKFTAMAVMALAIGAAGWAAPARTAEAAGGEISFSLNEKQVISNFFADGSGGDESDGDDNTAPRGGQGKGKGKGGQGKAGKGKGVGSQGMPPGLAMRGGPLPPGIAKRQLPGTLVEQLPPAPQGFERVIVDKDILLVNIGTQIVHDVLTGVLK